MLLYVSFLSLLFVFWHFLFFFFLTFFIGSLRVLTLVTDAWISCDIYRTKVGYKEVNVYLNRRLNDLSKKQTFGLNYMHNRGQKQHVCITKHIPGTRVYNQTYIRNTWERYVLIVLVFCRLLQCLVVVILLSILIIFFPIYYEHFYHHIFHLLTCLVIFTHELYSETVIFGYSES